MKKGEDRYKHQHPLSPLPTIKPRLTNIPQWPTPLETRNHNHNNPLRHLARASPLTISPPIQPLTSLSSSISISTIWLLAKRTSILSDDPILWFAMMLMPVGPPALKLTALADVTGSDDSEKMSIAKFLTVCCLFVI